jgi:ABC-2 type transport system permease protein
MGGTLGLAWRLHRPALIGWTVGFAIMGLIMGNVASTVGDLLGDSPQAREFFEAIGGQHRLVDTFLAAELAIMCLMASSFGIQAALRMRAEEMLGHAELLLVGPVSRVRWVLSHLAVAALGVVCLMLTVGAASGVAHGARVDDFSQILRLSQASLAYVPAALVMLGASVLLFALLPRLAVGLSWGLFGAFIMLGEIGPLLKLDDWVLKLSPFAHTPQLPSDTAHAGPLLGLTAVAVGLCALGTLALRRRDVA